jgi:LPXTG-motif cell wall-anchored protein
MDWIEQVFGIDPDFGSGSLEILIAGAVVLIVAGFVVYVRRRSDSREKVR